MTAEPDDGSRRSVTGLGPFDLGLATPKAELALGASEVLARVEGVAADADLTCSSFAVLASGGALPWWREKQVGLSSAGCLVHPPRTGSLFRWSLECSHRSLPVGRRPLPGAQTTG
jgi:hypothetical protein